jgi:hypothetical protein
LELRGEFEKINGNDVSPHRIAPPHRDVSPYRSPIRNTNTDMFCSPSSKHSRMSPNPFNLDEIFQEGQLKQVLSSIFDKIEGVNTKINEID